MLLDKQMSMSAFLEQKIVEALALQGKDKTIKEEARKNE